MKLNNKDEYMNITKEELREIQETMVDSGFKEREVQELKPNIKLGHGRLVKDPRDFTPYMQLEWLMASKKKKDYKLGEFEKRCRGKNWYNIYYKEVRIGEVFTGSDTKTSWAKIFNIDKMMKDSEMLTVGNYLYNFCKGLGINNITEQR